MSRDLGEQNLTILEAGKKGAANAALDEVEQTKNAQIAWDVDSDKTAEVSIQGSKGRLSGAAYGKIVWGATKEYVAGVRGSWSLRKK